MSDLLDNPIKLQIPMDIPDSLYQLLDILRQGGHSEAYIAGGAVRDTLIGKEPKDYDISTNVRPAEVVRRLSPYAKFAQIQGEKSFEVARIVAYDGNEYEFAPFRSEEGTRRGGRARVASSIKEDVLRRDLTINALFYNVPTKSEREEGIVGEVIDYVGGIQDIETETVRTVGDPVSRFNEDRLRILRAFRFAARVGGQIDESASQAIRENNSLREPSDAAVSNERISIEMIKGIRTAKIPSQYMNMLLDYNMFEQILPGLNAERSNSSSHSPAVQLASTLITNDSKLVFDSLMTLAFGKQISNATKFLIELSKISRENLINLKTLFKKLKSATNSAIDNKDIMDFGVSIGEDFKKFIRFAEAPPIVSAKELIASGMKPGPAIGEAIRTAEIEAYFQDGPSMSDSIVEARRRLGLVKSAAVANPLPIEVPNLNGDVYIFDMDDTLFWTPEWHSMIETSEAGDAVSVSRDIPNLFHRALEFVEGVNKNPSEYIRKDKNGNPDAALLDSYEGEIGTLRLIRNVIDIDILGKKDQVVFILSNAQGGHLGIDLLKKYFSGKWMKRFDLRGKYIPDKAIVGGDAAFYLTPKTLGTIPNEEVLDVYNKSGKNRIVLTARVSADGMEQGIRERLSQAGAPDPIAVFTKPKELSSGKYKGHIIGQIAQQNSVDSIVFYDDNLKYINDVKNVLENIYGAEAMTKVTIHKVDVTSKPQAMDSIRAESETHAALESLAWAANSLDSKGLVKEADMVDSIMLKLARKKKAVYTAAFLTDEGYNDLKQWWMTNVKDESGQLIGMLDEERLCHMTIKFKPSPEEVKSLSIGDTVTLRVTGYAENAMGQAVRVTGVESSNAVPHITVSSGLKEDNSIVSAAYSNQLLSEPENITEVYDGPELQAKIGFHNGKEPVYTFENSIYEEDLEIEIP